MKLKHRDDSMRANWCDYSNSGSYFITICTKDRLPFFGEIRNGQVYLSEVGRIVSEEWSKTAQLRPQMKLELHDFIVMPDHFHALLTIGITEFNGIDTCLDESGRVKKNQFKPQSNNLGSIVRGFKAAVTTRCKLSGLPFSWQSGYHDVVVRSPYQFENIQKYILENPKRKERDASRPH